MNPGRKGLIEGAIAIVFGFIILIAGTVKAQLSGYEILKLDISARASGMSGAFVGVSGDLHSLFYNPAGLIGISERSLSFTFLEHIVDIKSGSFVFAAPRGANSKYAIGGNYINYGTFEGRDINGLPAPSFYAQDIAVSGGYAGEYSP